MDHLRTVAHIFAAFGGPAPVASLCAVPKSTAASWHRRGSIPARYWPCLIAGAGANAIVLTADDLIAAHAVLPPIPVTARHASEESAA